MKTIRALLSTFMVLWLCALPALAVGYYATTSATSIAVAIPPGTAGNVMTSTGTTWTSSAPTGLASDFQSTTWYYWDDCINPGSASGGYGLNMFASGGTATDGAGEVGHPGIDSLSVAASTNRCTASFLGSTKGLLFGGGVVRSCAIIKTPSALSDGTDTYTIGAGFADSLDITNCTDGAFFKYTNAVNGGKWQCCTRSNSSETTMDSGVTFAVDTWYKLEVEVNAAATAVTYYINGTLVGTSITGTIPTGTGRETQPQGASILKAGAGAGSRTMLVDAAGVKQTLTTPR